MTEQPKKPSERLATIETDLGWVKKLLWWNLGLTATLATGLVLAVFTQVVKPAYTPQTAGPDVIRLVAGLLG